MFGSFVALTPLDSRILYFHFVYLPHIPYRTILLSPYVTYVVIRAPLSNVVLHQKCRPLVIFRSVLCASNVFPKQYSWFQILATTMLVTKIPSFRFTFTTALSQCFFTCLQHNICLFGSAKLRMLELFQFSKRYPVMDNQPRSCSHQHSNRKSGRDSSH